MHTYIYKHTQAEAREAEEQLKQSLLELTSSSKEMQQRLEDEVVCVCVCVCVCVMRF